MNDKELKKQIKERLEQKGKTVEIDGKSVPRSHINAFIVEECIKKLQNGESND